MKGSAITNCSSFTASSGSYVGGITAQTQVSPNAGVPVRLFRSYALGTLQQIVGTTPTYLLPGVGFGSRTLPLNFITNGMTFRLRYRAKQNCGSNGNMLFNLIMANVVNGVGTEKSMSTNTNQVPVAIQVDQAFGCELVWSMTVTGTTAKYSIGYLNVDREGQSMRVCLMDSSGTNTFDTTLAWEIYLTYATTTSNVTNNLTSYQWELDVI